MGNNFKFPCYGYKIFIPSNKSPDMKKNLPLSLLILFTVFAVLPGNTSYQNLSLQYRSYSIHFKMNTIVSDEILANETHAVDQISDVPAHNFFDHSISRNSKKGDHMIINQVGGAGIVFVRLYFEFTKFSGKKLAKSHTISVSQKTGG